MLGDVQETGLDAYAKMYTERPPDQQSFIFGPATSQRVGRKEGRNSYTNDFFSVSQSCSH